MTGGMADMHVHDRHVKCQCINEHGREQKCVRGRGTRGWWESLSKHCFELWAKTLKSVLRAANTTNMINPFHVLHGVSLCGCGEWHVVWQSYQELKKTTVDVEKWTWMIRFALFVTPFPQQSDHTGCLKCKNTIIDTSIVQRTAPCLSVQSIKAERFEKNNLIAIMSPYIATTEILCDRF